MFFFVFANVVPYENPPRNFNTGGEFSAIRLRARRPAGLIFPHFIG
jgi:hypothetical protein